MGQAHAPRKPTPPKSMLSAYQQRILLLTNTIRLRHNLPRVALSAHLNAVATRHNNDIAYVQQQLSHVSSDGSRLSNRLRNAGYSFRYASENVAKGQRTCTWVMTSWMKSPGHRKNILNNRASQMGVHVGVRRGVTWWTVVFGEPQRRRR